MSPMEREHVTDVQADDLSKPEAGAEREGVDEVVTHAVARGGEDRSDFTFGEGWRA